MPYYAAEWAAHRKLQHPDKVFPTLDPEPYTPNLEPSTLNPMVSQCDMGKVCEVSGPHDSGAGATSPSKANANCLQKLRDLVWGLGYRVCEEIRRPFTHPIWGFPTLGCLLGVPIMRISSSGSPQLWDLPYIIARVRSTLKMGDR